jgi:meso-butanediol dehydrogenase/(S,S)-butanediol dehydrogenase/diacetyl reductase
VRFTLVHELEILFIVTSAAWRYLSDSGGSIINTGSISARHGVAQLGTAAHSAAKGGVLGFTKQLAAEGAALDIRVNAISPGFVDTPGTSVVPGDTRSWIIGLHMLKRAAQASDIARCALYLASDESSYVTRAEYMVDAGFSAGRA